MFARVDSGTSYHVKLEGWLLENRIHFVDILSEDAGIWIIPTKDLMMGDILIPQRIKCKINKDQLMQLYRHTLSEEDEREQFFDHRMDAMCGAIFWTHVRKISKEIETMDKNPPKDEELAKQIFLETFFQEQEKHLLPFEEMIDIVQQDDPEKANELEEILLEAEREYQEQIWSHMIKYVNQEQILKFVETFAGSELSENFSERMALHPLSDKKYRNQARLAPETMNN